MTIGDRIKERRVALGMTQEELAQKLGYSGKTSVCRVENAGDKVSWKIAEKYADALGTTAGDLLGFKPKIAYPAEHFIDADPSMSKLFDIVRLLSPEQMQMLITYAEFLRRKQDDD